MKLLQFLQSENYFTAELPIFLVEEIERNKEKYDFKINKIIEYQCLAYHQKCDFIYDLWGTFSQYLG